MLAVSPAFPLKGVWRRLGFPKTWLCHLPRHAADGLGLDHNIEIARIITQISFVYSQKQHTVPLRNKVFAAPDENEIIIVITDHRDQCASRLSAHQLISIRDVRQTVGRRRTIVAQVYTSRSGDPKA